MVAAVPLARVVRSGLEESVHLGHVAVCDADGRLVAAAGDPDRLVFARSWMKPLQAAVSLAAIGDERSPTIASRRDVRLAQRRARAPRALVRALLSGPEARPSPCCGALPAFPSRTEDAIRAAAQTRRVFHNCSGKHAGMLLACVGAGWDTETYPAAATRSQREILRAVRRATGVDDPGHRHRRVRCAGARRAASRDRDPVRAARPAGAAGWPRADGRPGDRRDAGRALSWSAGPAGSTPADARRSGHRVEGGRRGVVCAAVLDEGLGVALKVADGGYRAAGPALVEVLAQLDAHRRGGAGRLSSGRATAGARRRAARG